MIPLVSTPSTARFAPQHAPVSALGMTFDCTDVTQTAELIAARPMRRNGSARVYVTPNIQHVAEMRRNPELRAAGTQTAGRISQRSAIRTPLVNPSPLGGQERVDVYTTFLSDGTLFYCLTIVPERDAPSFENAFQRVAQSIRLTESR